MDKETVSSMTKGYLDVILKKGFGKRRAVIWLILTRRLSWKNGTLPMKGRKNFGLCFSDREICVKSGNLRLRLYLYYK